MSQVKIHKVIQGVHMGLGHDGLAKLLMKELKVNVKTLAMGELVLCLNKKGDKLKLIGCQGRVLGYLKMPNGQPIMLDALRYIPETFGGQGFDYDAAVGKALRARMSPKPARARVAA